MIPWKSISRLSTHKVAASFRKSTKIGQKQGIKSNEKLYDLKFTFMMSICTLLIIDTFNRNIKTTVIEMALTDFFCS